MNQITKMIFCHHDYQFVRKLYGDEIIAHDFKRYEYQCPKCDCYAWKEDYK